jgi:hypothetical protein
MNAPALINQNKPVRKRLSTNAWIIIAVSALISVFLIYAVFNYFEIVDDTVEVGAKGEAKTNPYFGLQKFLAASGATVTLSNKTVELENVLAIDQPMQPIKNKVLMLGDRRLAEMRRERVDKIVDWVGTGGHLIVEAEQYYLADPLLARWGIGVRQLVYRKGKYVERETSNDDETINEGTPLAAPPDDANAENRADKNTGAPDADSKRQNKALPPPSERAFDLLAEKIAMKRFPTTIVLADGTPFTVRFQPYQNLVLDTGAKAVESQTEQAASSNKFIPPRDILPKDIALIRDRDGGRIIKFSHGLGKVTVLSNFDLMTYKNMGESDHAELIWHLVSSGNTAVPQVILALSRQGEGFLSWMLTHAWMVAVSAITLLLVWLWRVIPRMGPLAVPVPIARRSLIEHIVATGAYLVKKKQWQSLVAPLRLKFMLAFKARHPRVINMSESAMLQYAARQLQVDENVLARVLFIPVSNLIETLDVIRKLRQLLLKISNTTISNNG